MIDYPKWHQWAIELQSIAQAGLYYDVNEYDRERYERIRDISAEIMSWHTDTPLAAVNDMFCSDTGYLTPKMDTRGVIFQEGKLLLVREANGTWALPGGWIDVDRSVVENTVKEVREETGLDVTTGRLLAVLDRDKHNYRLHPRKIMICFVECHVQGGAFQPNSETVESRFFGPDELPSPLAVEKTTVEELDMCFRACTDPHWQTFFD